ncbi:MAG: ATP-binding protein [Myxococcota bacterium]
MSSHTRRSFLKKTGVGLAVVAKLADQLGERVWVESELGQGATFFVSIAPRSIYSEGASEGEKPGTA